MGLLISLVAALFILVIGRFARFYIPYIIIFFFIFFAEGGENFTSFNGSFVFNQDFVAFGRLKFIEFVAMSAYIAVLLFHKHNDLRPMIIEKRIVFAFSILISLLLCIEYLWHSAVSISDWRLMVSGFLIIYVITTLIDTQDKIIRFVKIFTIMLTIRAFIGLALWAAGHGVQSPRGMVPFFWDSPQVAAFGYGVILLATQLSNHKSIRVDRVMFSRWASWLMILILSITVLLSMRRSIIFSTILGSIISVIGINKTKAVQMILLLSFGIIAAMTIYISSEFRLESQFNTMNLMDKKIASMEQNAVHIDNIKQYSNMIMNYPSIIIFGIRSFGSRDYALIQKSYSCNFPLGEAHNGVLRTLLLFGIGGLLIYFYFYWRVVCVIFKLRNLEKPALMTYVGFASCVFIIMEFIPTLLFVPPFYTSCKGIFYTLLPLFFANYALISALGVACRQHVGQQRIGFKHTNV